MIELTRLNGHRVMVNCDLIKLAEPTPDTTLTLVTGEKLIVRESCDTLTERVLAYRSGILRHAWPDACAALGICAALDGSHPAIGRPTSDAH
jgi:flagellar protein FlbD